MGINGAVDRGQGVPGKGQGEPKLRLMVHRGNNPCHQ